MATPWRNWTERGRGLDRLGRDPRLAYGLSLLSVLVLTLVIVPLRGAVGGPTLSLLYVLLLFGVGVALGTGPAVVCAVFAFLLSDLLLYEPYLTLFVSKRHHLIELLIFLAIALGTGLLASRLRVFAEDNRREVRRTTMLYDLNRALISDVTLDQVLSTIVRGVIEIYGARGSRVLVRDEAGAGTMRTAAQWPAGAPPRDDRQVREMAWRALDSGEMAGIGGGGRRIRPPHGVAQPPRELPAASRDDVLYVPIGSSDERFGVLEVSGRPGGGRFLPEDARMLKSFADQAALAVQRAGLIEQATRAAALEQSSELKSALLAAVSHDLRTPLATIKMSASALRNDRADLPPEARAELLAAIVESTDWLTLVVDNLLDLSRIEGGALTPNRDWHDLEDLLQRVVAQMELQLAHHRVELTIDPQVPLVYLDYVQISQVMTNLIANAAKYSGDDSLIEVSAAPARNGQAVELRVRDHGIGIPAASLPFVFDTFYRVRSTTGVSGSGVGLAICKGLVEAHGGAITVESAPGEGTTFRVVLPVEPSETGRAEP